MVTQLTEDQERALARHAAARNQTPQQALDTLLSSPLPQRRAWTEQELALVRNPRVKPRDIAFRTGRTVRAVSVRRHKLATEENLPELMRRAK